MLDALFKLREHGTSLRTELLAGITTFLTMAYITFVNPAILADVGMDFGAVFVATCLAASFGSLVMGLYANYLSICSIPPGPWSGSPTGWACSIGKDGCRGWDRP